MAHAPFPFVCNGSADALCNRRTTGGKGTVTSCKLIDSMPEAFANDAKCQTDFEDFVWPELSSLRHERAWAGAKLYLI